MIPLDVLTWQATIASADGPKSYTMRAVLLALAARIFATGGTTPIRITHNELAEASALSRRWVIMQLEQAEQDGWLTIGRPRKTTQRAPACEYALRLPEVPRGTTCADHAEARP